MSFDGLTMHLLTDELQEKLVGSKIDKIYQPEKDELLIQLRGKKGNYKLIISVNSAMPFLTLTDQKRENPKTPPMFCMLLRKHLTGGRILEINQHYFDRVLLIDIEAKDEMGHPSTKTLIVEIMGKHSNIILIDKDTSRIIDGIKHITPEISRVRSIMPNLTYHYIDNHKKNGLEVDLFDLKTDILNDEYKTLPIFKFVYQYFDGFSPLIAKEICNRIQIEQRVKMHLLEDNEIEKLLKEVQNILHYIHSQSPIAYVYETDRHKIIDITFMPIMAYEAECYSKKAFLSISDALNYFYFNQNKDHKLYQKSNDLRKVIQSKISRDLSKRIKLQTEIDNAQNHELYKLKGELILANIYQISKGDEVLTAINYYDEAQPTIEITLDPRYEPGENAQRYFKKYNKLKTAQVLLKEQIQESNDNIQYYENVLIHLDNAENMEDIEAIRAEMSELGLIKKKHQKKSKKGKTKEVYKQYISSTGYVILVGKNNKQNDTLTLKYASNKDIWLHTKDIPGSHTIIRTEGTTPDNETIMEAANIAAYFSKAKDSSQVPVDYCPVKNVLKPNGAKPGMVIYENYNTVYVTPDLLLIEKLEKKKEI